jgi:hypothetical protein
VRSFPVGEPNPEFLRALVAAVVLAAAVRAVERRRRRGIRLRLLGLHRLSVPLGIVEVLVSLDEIEDGEEILAVEQPRSAPDDLLEFNHRANGTHQHYVAHVARVDAGRELVRGGQDRGNGYFVVLRASCKTIQELS